MSEPKPSSSTPPHLQQSLQHPNPTQTTSSTPSFQTPEELFSQNNNCAQNNNGVDNNQQFVPYYLRTDLKHNRTSKKRTNPNQRRRRKTVEELVKDFNLTHVTPTSTSSSTASSVACSPAPELLIHPNNAASSSAASTTVSASSAPSPAPTHDSAQSNSVYEMLQRKQFQEQQTQQPNYSMYQQNFYAQQFPSVNNIKYQLFRNVYQGQQMFNQLHTKPRYQLSPTVNQLVQKWEERKIQEQQQEAVQQLVASPNIQITRPPPHPGSPSSPSSPQSSRHFRLPSLRLAGTPHNPNNYKLMNEQSPSMSYLNLEKVKPVSTSRSGDSSQGSASMSNTDIEPPLSPTSSTSSASEDVEFTNAMPLLPSISKQFPTLPPLALHMVEIHNFSPPSSSSPRYHHYSSSTQSSPRTNGSLSSLSSTPNHSPRMTPRITPRASPRHAPYPVSSRRQHVHSNGQQTDQTDQVPLPVFPEIPDKPNTSSNHMSTTSLMLPPPAPASSSQNTHPTPQRMLFESVFQYSPLPMAILTVNGHFVSCNQQFVEMLGFERDEELKHQPVSYFLDTRTSASTSSPSFNEQLMTKLLAAEKSRGGTEQNSARFLFRKRDGTSLDTLQVMSVIRDCFNNGAFFCLTTLQIKV